jgi:thiol-disulfide isomerase/thioredoxin
MKYTLEGGIDFYKELNDSLDINNNDNYSNKCLITYIELKDYHIELNCGHKFNYGPLYKDIFNYKKKFNNMEQMNNKLKINEIRCPYCRKVHPTLLKYYENLPYPKEHGVNYLDFDKMHCNNKNMTFINNHQCQYETILTDDSGNTFINKCFNYGYIQNKLKEKYNINNNYCYQHKGLILKELKQQEKDKIKMEKIKLKEEKKQLEKIEKEAKKQSKTKQLHIQEQIVLNGNINIIPENKCIIILKSGKNKGVICSANIYKDCLCKRHFNLLNKDIKS